MSNLGFHCHRLSQLTDGVLSNGLSRGEFYNFPPKDLPRLKRQIQAHDLAASIHAPLVQLDWYPIPPTWSFLCDSDKEKRDLTLRMITGTMEQAQDFGAEYVVVHFPTPVSKPATGAWAELETIALRSCDQLAELSSKFGVPIHIEGVGASLMLTADFLCWVLAEYTSLRYCFDTGHMHLAASACGFDLYALARELEPYVGSLHIWNTRGFADYHNFGHLPAHPSQRPEDGWVDLPRILELLGSTNRSIIFESGYWYPESLGGYDYRDGVQWVKELLKTSS